MNCQQVLPLTHAYSDAELDLVRTLELEQHLAICPGCSQAYENIQALKARLKSADLYYSASQRLKQQIRSASPDQSEQAAHAPFAWRDILRYLVPVAATALIAFLLIPSFHGASAENELAQEIVSSHVRSLMLDHKTDVTSTDQHTVKPWFQGKLDFTPRVMDPAEQGFPLIGGRLDYVHGRPVAALVYQRHQHFINLFIWPAGSNSNVAEKSSARQGFNLIRWSGSGMTFWAVSDLNLSELGEFVELVK